MYSLIIFFWLLVKRKYNSIVLGYCTLILISLSIVYGLFGVHKLLAILPGGDVSLNHRILFGADFGLAVLTSFGLQFLFEKRESNVLKQFTLGPIVPGFIVLILTVVSVFTWAQQALSKRGSDLSLFLDNLDIFLFFWSICMLTLWTAYTFRNSEPLRIATLIIITLVLFLDLFNSYSDLNTATSTSKLYPQTRTIGFLQDRLGTNRFSAIGNVILPNIGMYFDLRDPRGYDALADKDYITLLTSYHPQIRQGQGTWFKNPHRGFLDLTSVRYLLSEVPLPNWRAPFKPYGSIVKEWDMGDLWVYERGDAFERLHYYQLPACKIVDTFSKNIDFKSYAEIERKTIPESGDIIQRLLSQKQSSLQSKTFFFREYGNRIEAKCAVSEPCLAFINTSYHHGWNCVINGQKTDVMRVNGNFMGVLLKQGENHLHLTMKPWSFQIGLFCTLLTVASLIAVFVFRVLLNLNHFSS